MGRSGRLCIMFDAHRQAGRDVLIRSYERIVDLFARHGEIVAVFDGVPPPNTDFGRTIVLSRDEIFKSFPHVKGDFIIPGNVDLKIVAAVAALPEFDFFVRIEFDVWPSQLADDRTAELCDIARSGRLSASFIRNGHHDADWIYWSSLNDPDGNEITKADRHAAFLPLMTFSRSFIDYYKEMLRIGWTGHYEALMPTLARKAGITLVELGEAGEKLTFINEFNVTSQRFAPPVSGAFLHPFKSLEQITQIEAPYLNDIVATPAETRELERRFKNANSYLEFGSGGTTALACHSGVQRITSVETDLSFLSSLIQRYSLRRFIDTGRLSMRHVEVGRTGKWGYPRTTPPDRQIENYLSWPKMVPDADLVLLDGRFRVATAAECAIRYDANTEILIHDYQDREQYRIVESFMTLTDCTDSLAMFRPDPARREQAKRVRQDYFYKMD